MIKNSEPLSLSEAKVYIDSKSDQGAKVLAFSKKFESIEPKKAQEMRKKLEDLNLVKLNSHQITKIIEFLPENSEEMGKIFTEVNLDEDETKKISEIVDQFK